MQELRFQARRDSVCNGGIRPALGEISRRLVPGESRSDRPQFVIVEIQSDASAIAQSERLHEFAQQFDRRQLCESEPKAVQFRAQFRRLLAAAGIRLLARSIARLAIWILPKSDLVRSWGATSIPCGLGMKRQSNEKVVA
jgi:hypothetical protein